MKKLLKMRNVLIAIAFTVFLLLIKDNMDVVWKIISSIIGILTPFILGFLFAYILNFPYKFFHNKLFSKMGKKRRFFLKLKKPLSIICTYLIVAAVITALFFIVVPQIGSNISTLVKHMPEYYQNMLKYVNDLFGVINNTFNTNFNLDSTIQEIYNQIDKFFADGNWTNTAGNATQVMWDMISNTTSGLYNFAMAIIISVYLLSAKETLCYQMKKLAVAFIPIKYLPKVYEIVDITDTKCGRFLVGDIIDAAVLGLLSFVVMSIFQIPYAALIAVMIGITNIIPFFGPFIGAIPSAFILLLVDPWKMILFIIIIFVIQQIDGNLLKPKIIGNQVGLSSFWVLFSVVLGGSLFGIVGFILGTPIYAVIYSLVGKNVRNKIKDKGKIAQEALDFEVLNYAKIAEEQKRIREEKENQQKEKLRKLIRLNKSGNDDEDNKDDNEDIGS